MVRNSRGVQLQRIASFSASPLHLRNVHVVAEPHLRQFSLLRTPIPALHLHTAAKLDQVESLQVQCAHRRVRSVAAHGARVDEIPELEVEVLGVHAELKVEDFEELALDACDIATAKDAGAESPMNVLER